MVPLTPSPCNHGQSGKWPTLQPSAPPLSNAASARAASASRMVQLAGDLSATRSSIVGARVSQTRSHVRCRSDRRSCRSLDGAGSGNRYCGSARAPKHGDNEELQPGDHRSRRPGARGPAPAGGKTSVLERCTDNVIGRVETGAATPATSTDGRSRRSTPRSRSSWRLPAAWRPNRHILCTRAGASCSFSEMAQQCPDSAGYSR